jgi:outer membrane protein OmpA-like peptidoglycan-associated protein
MRLTVAGKIAVLLVVLGVVFGGYRLFAGKGGGNLMAKLAPEAKTRESVVPVKADLPSLDPATTATGTTAVSLPGSEPGCTDRPEVRMLGYAWNAQMGLHFANGGPQASKGSLMCKNGVNLKWERQDDNSKLQENLVAFATELSRNNPQPKNGVHFVTIMGDGAPAFIAGLNDALRKIGPDYTAKIVGAAGYSRGEDKFMGPAAWKANPVASRGGLVAGVLRDGDWNIAQKWLGDNGLRTNPDEKTWDPDALNWVAANDYIDAAEKYVSGYSEDRPVVRNGKKTGETKRVTVNGVVTWTPGDVTVAQKKGGLVSIVSTKEYTSQMPCVIIGINKWMKQNPQIVQGMLQAISEGGDEVKRNPSALRRAAEISAALYRESGADAAYWEKYFKGTQEADKTGQMVELGGSTVNNLADNLILFGLVPGAANVYAATYRVFGDIASAQYPDLLPSYPPVEAVVDTSYLQALARKGPAAAATMTAAVAKQKPVFVKSQPVKSVVSRRAWNINFESGKAAFGPAAASDLERLRRDLLVAGGTAVEIHGHTDNQGAPDKNMALSEARAFAVKNWLEKKAPVNFPAGRIRVFAHGQTNPVAPNGTPQGRAQNRRVEVVIGTTGA